MFFERIDSVALELLFLLFTFEYSAKCMKMSFGSALFPHSNNGLFMVRKREKLSVSSNLFLAVFHIIHFKPLV